MTSRLPHLDIAKGIGIAFVVLGHNWITLDEKGELFRVIFSFHMPLFFFLAGVLFRPEQPFAELLRSKSSALLKPYALASLISLVVTGFSLWSLFGAAYASGDWLAWVPLWFLPHLWLLFLAAWCFVRLTHFEARSALVQGGLLLILLVVGCALLPLFWHWPLRWQGAPVLRAGQPVQLPGLPFCADLLPLTGCYFLAGYALRELVKAFRLRLDLTALALLVFAGLHYRFDWAMDLNERVYDNLIVSTLEAVTGIYLVLVMSDLLARWTLAARAVAYLGSGSLFIMMFHPWFQDHVFALVDDHFDDMDWLSVSASFFAGLLLPLLLWEGVKRNAWLTRLWLPAAKQPSARL